MLTEQCVACGADVPLGSAVHMLVNPKGDEGVTDGYLCRGCYEEHVQPILPGDEPGDEPDDATGGDEPRSGDDAEGPLGDDAEDPGSTGGDDPEPGEV